MEDGSLLQTIYDNVLPRYSSYAELHHSTWIGEMSRKDFAIALLPLVRSVARNVSRSDEFFSEAYIYMWDRVCNHLEDVMFLKKLMAGIRFRIHGIWHNTRRRSRYNPKRVKPYWITEDEPHDTAPPVENQVFYQEFLAMLTPFERKIVRGVCEEDKSINKLAKELSVPRGAMFEIWETLKEKGYVAAT